MAVEVRQVIADGVKVQEPVDIAQQVILGDVILDPEPIKQVFLRFQPSHHCSIPLPSDTIESVSCPLFKAFATYRNLV